MKRIISFLLTLMLTLSFAWIPTTYGAETSGETLRRFGLLTGDQNGNLNENQYLTRAEMMVILSRMLGEYNQAFNYTRKSGFTDGNNHWAERYVAYAQFRGWTAGIGNNKFGYENRHTVQEASVFMLKALGYIADVDFTWNTAYNKAVQLGLFSSTNLRAGNDILRGDLFSMMLKTIYTKVKGLDVTLGEVLNVIPPTSSVFEVKSINSSSLKEIVITFSKSLDRTTVQNSDFSIPGHNLTATVLADGFTVSLISDQTFGNLSQYTVSISNIRSSDGLNLSAVSKTFVVNDTTPPRVTSIKPLGTSTLEITFSEPIKSLGTVTVNSPSVSLNVSSLSGVGSSKVIVQLSGFMANGVNYTVTAREFLDYANNMSTMFTGNMLFQPDTTPITAKVLSADQVSVAFEFNRSVKGLTTSHFYHTYAAWTPIGIFKDPAMTQSIITNEEISTVYVKFATLSGTSIVGNQLPTGAVNVMIKEYNDTGLRITDTWGNAFSGGTYLVNVTVDTTKPTVTKLEMLTGTTVAIEFSENVNFSKSNLMIQYSTGTDIPNLTFTVSGSGRSYIAKMNDLDLSGSSIKFTIANVSDLALIPNVLTSYTKTLTVPDLIDPFVVEIVKDPTRPALLVQYNERMGSTALSRSNYEIRVGTTRVPLTKTPTNFYSNQVIRLELTDSEFAFADSSSANLWISGVKDVAGNTIATKTYRLSTTKDISEIQPQLLDVKAIDRNTVLATFDQVLVRADASAFKIVIDGKEYAVSTPTLETNSSNQTIVTLKPSSTSGYLPYDTALSDLKITTTSTVRVQNIYGINVLNTIEPIRDNIKPAISKFTTAPNTGKDIILRNGNTITITFTEDLNPDYVSKDTFTVSRATVTDAIVTGGEITLTITPADNMLAAPTLTMRSEVRDVNGNRFRDTRTLQSINVTP